jgi:hypothetical protein
LLVMLAGMALFDPTVTAAGARVVNLHALSVQANLVRIGGFVMLAGTMLAIAGHVLERRSSPSPELPGPAERPDLQQRLARRGYQMPALPESPHGPPSCRRVSISSVTRRS